MQKLHSISKRPECKFLSSLIPLGTHYVLGVTYRSGAAIRLKATNGHISRNKGVYCLMYNLRAASDPALIAVRSIQSVG